MFRLEFRQPDGRWTGPYCAEWMTPAAFEVRDLMIRQHYASEAHPWPDPKIFRRNPGPRRHVCASRSFSALATWFGPFFWPLIHHGGHVARYEVPASAIAWDDGLQVVYPQQAATLVHRLGRHPCEPLVERIHPTKAA